MTGFFQRLFSKRQAAHEPSPPPLESRLEIDEFGHNLVSIDALDFIGHQAVSPNKRYRLVWADRTPNGRQGVRRQSLIIKQISICYIARPQNVPQK